MNKNTTYKPTGNKWIPQIPEHWEILKAKHLGNFQGSTVDKKSVKGEKKIRMLNFTDVYGNQNLSVKGDIDFMQLTARDNQIRDFKLNVGDMVFTPSSEISEDIGQSALIEYEAADLLFSYHLIRLSFTRKVNHNFKKYLFNNRPTLKYFSKVCKGSTRKILNRIDFKNIPIFLPPYDEQGRIAKYLDHKTTEIQNFIAKKQNLINLLKEQRQTIINDLLCQNNENWLTVRLKYVCKSNADSLLENTPKNYSFKYIDIGNVNSDGTITEMQEMTFQKSPSRARRKLKFNDIIISTVRTYLRAIAINKSSDENLIASTGFAVLSHNEKILPDFLIEILRTDSFIDSVISNSYGVSYPAITASALSCLKISYPESTDDQQRIVNKIKSETKDIDTVIAKTQKEIDLIKEYKESLITEAVTGKITIS